MKSDTIDYGIDLGTTNSSIAKLNGKEVEVIENNENQKLTPSAVWISEKNRLFTGQYAKNRLFEDPENAYSKWKPSMGKTDIVYTFAKTGRAMTPEELSSEILKSLRTDVKQRKGDDVDAAVITVPADFELHQVDATKKAADLAGIKTCEILQEPIAAAMAYGFLAKGEEGDWMVYDFGGGTFDVAIIRLRSGDLSVVNHGGDANLGGELIDWDIVNSIFVPMLISSYRLNDFNRNNKKWISAFAKMKRAAEDAKIQLSRVDIIPIFIENLCQDDNGEWITFDHELTRKDIEPLLVPYIERTINKCKDVLQEAKLNPDDIKKIVLVGGPTLTPLLRKLLRERLDIHQEFSIDPLTVVAQGAAIYAASRRIERGSEIKTTEPGILAIELDYKPMGSTHEPLVMGRVVSAEGQENEGYTIEFIERKSQWRSGKISLSDSGTFRLRLRAEEDRRNDYSIEIRNAKGDIIKSEPGEIHYTVGITPRSSLVHSIGVELADQSFLPFLEKGRELPAEVTKTLRTTVELKKGQSGSVVRIPIREGENVKRADRNSPIGIIEIFGNDTPRDLPVRSEVEVKLSIDESRLTNASAWIPSIPDKEFRIKVDLGRKTIDHSELNKKFREEKERLAKIESQYGQITGTSQKKVQEIMQRIRREQLSEDISGKLSDSRRGDREASNQGEERLRALTEYLDEAEMELEWPNIERRTDEFLAATQAIIEQCGGTESQRMEFLSIKDSIKSALLAHDRYTLEAEMEKMGELTRPLLINSFDYLQAIFTELMKSQSKMTNQDAAKRLFMQGKVAVSNRDREGLRMVLAQLVTLLPKEELGGLSTVSF